MSLPSPFVRVLASLMLFFVTSTVTACGHSGPTGSADLAVDRVVLYQSGVAYVERTGEVSGDEVVLRVRPDQINDVLSSLVVIDLDGGAPATVSLPARTSDEDQSALSAVIDAGSLEALLSSLRGADVRVHHGASRTRGRVLAVESSPSRLSLLVDGESAKFIALNDIDKVEFENEAVALRIRHSLDESMSADDWQSAEVTLRFPDEQSRRNLMVSWVVESPLWKPTYRVLIEGDDQFVLQGWALVDNLSGEDWNTIELSLASGTPLSFRFDLHSPIHIERPDMSGYGVPQAVDLEPPSPMRARPQEQRQRSRAGRAAPSPDDDAAMGTLGVGQGRSGRGGGATFGVGDFEAEEEEEVAAGFDADDRIASAGSSAGVQELDSLFRFDIPDRVTLPDRSSTLVTLVNSEVDGRDKLVFQPDSGSSRNHPYRSLVLHNTTNAPVQRSPIAIYRDGAFVGEGITPQIAPEEQAVLPYALESRVHVDRKRSSRSGEVRLLQIRDGKLRVEREQHQIWSFDVTSSLSDDQTLYVQVPRQNNHELIVDEDLDVRRESDFYLVPIDLPAGESRVEEIAQIRKVPANIEVFAREAQWVLVSALEGSELRPDVAESLETVTEALEELTDLKRKVNKDRRLRGDIETRTRELRANLEALGDGDQHQQLRGRLVDRLEEQDELLSTVAARIVENSEKQSVLRIEIQELMRDIRL